MAWCMVAVVVSIEYTITLTAVLTECTGTYVRLFLTLIGRTKLDMTVDCETPNSIAASPFGFCNFYNRHFGRQIIFNQQVTVDIIFFVYRV
jgi:hypothetical protein